MERSDVIVQIVDSRNPLLFRNADLEKYASEFDPPKKCVLLVNKADLLSEKQIEIWQKYFDEQNISAIFWSAASAKKEEILPEQAEVSEDLQRVSISEPDSKSPYIKDTHVSEFLKNFSPLILGIVNNFEKHCYFVSAWF